MEERYNLTQLAQGESGYVREITASPVMERRLHDLGLVPGTRITCVTRSPSGDPCAYLIRGALIAIRRQDAQGITLVGGNTP